MGKFLVKKTATGIKFDLKAGNGEVIGTSEIYTSEKACMNGIESVKKNAPIAEFEDQTVNRLLKQNIRNLKCILIKRENIASVSRRETVNQSLLQRAIKLRQAALTVSKA